jgi:hypothetical protein
MTRPEKLVSLFREMEDGQAIRPNLQSDSSDRRAFLKKLCGAAALGAAAGATELTTSVAPASAHERTERDGDRAQEAFKVRVRAAIEERDIPPPSQATNGDEERYANYIGSYSKGLPHNAFGEVDRAAYGRLLDAAREGKTEAFEEVPLGGTIKLVNPMAGVAFDLEGTDSHQLAVGPPPAVASQVRADDMVELYWMALCRDVNFTQYGSDPSTRAATAELSPLAGYAEPKSGGAVTAQSLFRGFTAEDVIGPYVSQLLLRPFSYGQYAITGRINTYSSGLDYLTDQNTWLAARNGQGSFVKNQTDPQARFVRNGRDLAAYVHTDQAFEAFYNAGIWLAANGAPANSGSPYLALTKQSSFATFGGPHFLCLLAEAANRALKAVWYAKWFVHRTLRPEDFGGLVHMTKTRQTSYPLHADVLDSQAVQHTFLRYGSYFQPQAYPEGCPQHPSYAQGHGSIAGACATILKAAFNGNVPFHTLGNGALQVASEVGLSLVPYSGADSEEITINGEINKLASNIGLGRNFAGVHWRTDYSDGLKLGEAVALSILADQKGVYGEDFEGFQITKFDGTTALD